MQSGFSKGAMFALCAAALIIVGLCFSNELIRFGSKAPAPATGQFRSQGGLAVTVDSSLQ
ncbi:hypothetical protein EMIT0196MI5_200060 [Pseudomonas sp. IT-196MI5]